MKAETDPTRSLATGTTTLSPGDTFYESAEEFRRMISQRAYELFELRGFEDGHDLDDWFQAVSEILVDAPIQIAETETEITVRVDVPGFTEKDLEVRVAPRSLCIRGNREQVSEAKEEAGRSERRVSQVFRTLDLPAEVDLGRVNATVSGTVLEIKMAKVGQGKKISVSTNAATA